MHKHIVRRILAALAAVWLLFSCASAGAQVNPTIRVYLRRLDIADSVQIEFNGDYMLEGGGIAFSSGTQVDISLRGNRLVLHAPGLAISLGQSIKLLRCAGDTPGGLILNGNGVYEGDLTLDITDDVIRPVLSIDIEDYLLGVVPYEMGDSFPLEALKAQAIAARTYALRKSGSSGAYDVEDTTNDQAFRGRNSYSPLSEQAVYETAGLVGMYRGELAQCYYSASNGGQTELGQHVWPTDDPDMYGYMDMRDDPYDLTNDASLVRRYTVHKKSSGAGVGTALHSALVTALDKQLAELGYAAEDDLVRIDQVTEIVAQTPRFDGESRLMTELAFTVKLSLREATYRDIQPTPIVLADPDDPQATPAATLRPTATPAYSPFVAIDQTFTVVLPIFGTGGCEQAMGLSISTAPNELITVTDIGSSFMIEARRYGHGVGMSQRGAEQMARKHGMTVEQILAFYYPGMEIAPVVYDRAPLPTPDMELMATPAPTPSPTPRPTLMPVSEVDLPEGAYIAVVSNIDEDSSLNLREEPSLSADVLRRLYKDQRLVVLQSSADGWSHVRTDVIEGYVRTEYLQTAENGE